MSVIGNEANTRETAGRYEMERKGSERRAWKRSRSYKNINHRTLIPLDSEIEKASGSMRHKEKNSYEDKKNSEIYIKSQWYNSEYINS